MRYAHAKSGAWVEIAGAADLPMREVTALYEPPLERGYEIAKKLIKDWHFITDAGADVPLGDMAGLSLRQWAWLRGRIVDAAGDEMLDPEA